MDSEPTQVVSYQMKTNSNPENARAETDASDPFSFLWDLFT